MLLLQLLMLLLMLLFLLLTNLAIVLRRRLLSSLLHIVLYCSQPPIGLASGDGSGGDGGSKTLSLLSRSVCFPFLSFHPQQQQSELLEWRVAGWRFPGKEPGFVATANRKTGVADAAAFYWRFPDWLVFLSPRSHCQSDTHTHTHSMWLLRGHWGKKKQTFSDDKWLVALGWLVPRRRDHRGWQR